MSIINKSVGSGGRNNPDDVAIIQFYLGTTASATTRKPYLPKARIDGQMSRELETAIGLLISDLGTRFDKAKRPRLEAGSNILRALHKSQPGTRRRIRALWGTPQLYLDQSRLAVTGPKPGRKGIATTGPGSFSDLAAGAADAAGRAKQLQQNLAEDSRANLNRVIKTVYDATGLQLHLAGHHISATGHDEFTLATGRLLWFAANTSSSKQLPARMQRHFVAAAKKAGIAFAIKASSGASGGQSGDILLAADRKKGYFSRAEIQAAASAGALTQKTIGPAPSSRVDGDVARVQFALAAAADPKTGKPFYKGPVNGVLDKKTLAAIAALQRAAREPASGKLTPSSTTARVLAGQTAKQMKNLIIRIIDQRPVFWRNNSEKSAEPTWQVLGNNPKLEAVSQILRACFQEFAKGFFLKTGINIWPINVQKGSEGLLMFEFEFAGVTFLKTHNQTLDQLGRPKQIGNALSQQLKKSGPLRFDPKGRLVQTRQEKPNRLTLQKLEQRVHQTYAMLTQYPEISAIIKKHGPFELVFDPDAKGSGYKKGKIIISPNTFGLEYETEIRPGIEDRLLHLGWDAIDKAIDEFPKYFQFTIARTLVHEIFQSTQDDNAVRYAVNLRAYEDPASAFANAFMGKYFGEPDRRIPSRVYQIK